MDSPSKLEGILAELAVLLEEVFWDEVEVVCDFAVVFGIGVAVGSLIGFGVEVGFVVGVDLGVVVGLGVEVGSRVGVGVGGREVGVAKAPPLVEPLEVEVKVAQVSPSGDLPIEISVPGLEE